MESMAIFMGLPSDIVLLKFIYYQRVEKHFPALQEVTETVKMAFRSNTVSKKASARLLSIRS